MITIYKFFTYKGSLRSLRISQEDGLNRKIAAVATDQQLLLQLLFLLLLLQQLLFVLLQHVSKFEVVERINCPRVLHSFGVVSDKSEIGNKTFFHSVWCSHQN
jgi:hypothetical protein